MPVLGGEKWRKAPMDYKASRIGMVHNDPLNQGCQKYAELGLSKRGVAGMKEYLEQPARAEKKVEPVVEVPTPSSTEGSGIRGLGSEGGSSGGRVELQGLLNRALARQKSLGKRSGSGVDEFQVKTA